LSIISRVKTNTQAELGGVKRGMGLRLPIGRICRQRKLEIVASFCEAKTAKEHVKKYRLEPHFVKENFL